ncbi:BTB/POZ domain-containing protein 6-like [Orbicella faveolata]|uniref:BTB/POZ domain-containing protein 6-like n=1 Tax=Orbicella faveolata TaxID=48498 RepID=UPI0009E572E6|nr:BTB/POZ domain-containing protein 6-like [Orbicella faveolata]
MSVVERNWQTTRPTIRERNKFMFNNDLFSDVKFLVKRADDESESKQVIPAHKFVLSISSPVFEAMFYGELAKTTDTIEVPDCEYDSLLELFRYMYSDEVILSVSNVMGVLYFAKKYMVPSLANKCTEYLHNNLDPSNVFNILPSALKYEEKTLAYRCWEVIDKQTEEAVKSDGFGTIKRALLEGVVERDTLTIKEIELFKAVDFWATKECNRQRLTVNGAAKRRVLGESLVKALRFPTMDQRDFASVVLDSKILTLDEITCIIKDLNSVPSSLEMFPKTKRCGVISRCNRFGWPTYGLDYFRASKDAISLSVDKDIVLHGVCLFGRQNTAYSVDLEVIDSKNKSVSVSLHGKFYSEELQARQYTYYGFKVSFGKIILKKNTRYDITARILGSSSLRGEGGVSSVQCSGVTFTFMNSEYSSNGTSVYSGQFSELLFSL